MKLLPNNVKLFIPSSKLHRVQADLERQLVAGVGGFTASSVLGGWRGHDGTVVKEQVVVYDIFYRDEDATIVSEVVFDVCFDLLQTNDPEEAVLLQDQYGGGVIIHASDVTPDTVPYSDAIAEAVVPA